MKNRLKELRMEKGLTQEELGNQLGLANNTISRYETGSNEPPKFETWQKLADFFGVSVTYLQGLSQEWYQAECLECGKVLRVSQSDADELTCCPFCKKFYFSMSKVN